MKNYTALFLPDVYSRLTKTGFKTIFEAESYIQKFYSQRSDWLIINTANLDKHLTNFDEQYNFQSEGELV